MRELTRSRTSAVRERSAAVHQLQKVLEGAKVKLAAVASDAATRLTSPIPSRCWPSTTPPRSTVGT